MSTYEAGKVEVLMQRAKAPRTRKLKELTARLQVLVLLRRRPIRRPVVRLPRRLRLELRVGTLPLVKSSGSFRVLQLPQSSTVKWKSVVLSLILSAICLRC